ncbi:MAG: hypothetical protein ABSB33_12590 [Tepidisphaeraceae bacterium]|jgi:hypothetical protein
MDLSKLPRLSKTSEAERLDGRMPPSAIEPSAVESEPPAVVPYARSSQSAPAAGWSETWLSIGIGIFLLLYQPRFLQWLSSRLFHTYFNEFRDADSNIVPYQTLPEFWSDLGPTLFGFVLIIDGLVMFTRRRGLYWAAFGLTIVSTAFNLVWCIGSYSKYGFAPISFLAVIFGGFIATAQWRLIKLQPLP